MSKVSGEENPRDNWGKSGQSSGVEEKMIHVE